MVELNFYNQTQELWFMMNLDLIGQRYGIKLAILRGEPIDKICYDGDKNTVVNNPKDYLRIRNRLPDVVQSEE